jgi:phosphohistidine phosphatase
MTPASGSASARRSATLYLVRHAIAAERGAKWPDDGKRPLTHKGAARMRLTVRGLRRLGAEIDLILTSPLVRARQTADIVAEGIGSAPEVIEVDALTPDQSPPAVGAALAPYASVSRIALVGHEPGLGELAAWLVGAREPIEFKKGAVCRIDVPALPPGRNGRLIWLALPKMLRSMA